MDTNEWITETVQQAKLHKEMCRALSRALVALNPVFPSLAAVRPGSKQGLRALSGLQLALEKAKALLLYCATSSKLYLAMTGDSVLQRFAKVNSALHQNLVQLGEIVSESLSDKIALILKETSQMRFSLEPKEKQIGAEIISMLLREKDAQSAELIFEQIASCLGLLSPHSLVEEQHALDKLLENARKAGDQKKSSILQYFLFLLKNLKKRLKSNSSSSVQEQRQIFSRSPVHRSISDAATICSKDEMVPRQSQVLGSGRSMPMIDVPEHFRCPISSQLMSDPVIIASGQTYERVSIERWFEQGHNTCPKTKQMLPDLSMIENVCIKKFIATWCQEKGIPVPVVHSPPDLSDMSHSSWSFSSLDGSFGSGDIFINNETLSVLDASNNRLSVEESCDNESDPSDRAEDPKEFEDIQRDKQLQKSCKEWWLQNLEQMFADLSAQDWDVQCLSVKNIRMLTSDIPRALGHIEHNILRLLVKFLGKAVHFGCTKEQEMAVLILLDLSRFDRENKKRLVGAGVISYLLEILKSVCEQKVKREALSLMILLSCQEEARKQVPLSGAIPVLIELLSPDLCLSSSAALTTLCNLSTDVENQRQINHHDVVFKLVHLLKTGQENVPRDCLCMLYHITLSEEGRNELVKSKDCIITVVECVGTGTNEERELAVAILLLLCKHSPQISQLIKQEAVTSYLTSLSVQPSERGKEMAQGLLHLLHK